MKMKLSAILLVIVMVLVACGNAEDNKSETLNADDLKALVQDFTDRTVTAEAASITSNELIVTEEDETETIYNLPEDEFFVSIAPFETQTHPCEIHSLTGCQGELADESFQVKITDDSGEEILNENYKTGENGFIDLWLPRDETFTVEITHEDKETISEISTYEGDNTCITTMQLS